MKPTRDPASPLSHVRLVRVGTQNPPKLEATRAAVDAYAPGVQVEGVDVESGVPEQPVGFEEIVKGARTRARAAFESGACELAVGIEDGLVRIDALGDDLVNVGAAAVTDGRRVSVGLSSGFAYPPGCSHRAADERIAIGGLFDELMREVEPMDDAGETVDSGDTTPSAMGEGNIGRLTRGVLPRAEYGRHAVLCALVRFLHPALYDARNELVQDAPHSTPDDAPDDVRGMDAQDAPGARSAAGLGRADGA